MPRRPSRPRSGACLGVLVSRVVEVAVRHEAEDQVQSVGEDQDDADRDAQLVLGRRPADGTDAGDGRSPGSAARSAARTISVAAHARRPSC